MSSTEPASYSLGLLCIRDGKGAGIKKGQIVEVLAETPTSWEIELVKERRQVSKLSGQIRGDWDSPWFTLTVIESRKKNMLGWLRGRLKWWIAGEELAELHRWRVQWHEYRRWLDEFKEVGEALDSMKANVEGQSLDACLPPTGEGPWTVEGVRARARAMRYPWNQ